MIILKTMFTKISQRKLFIFFILLILLNNLSCIPSPTQNTAVITLKNNWTFPFVFLDFKSSSIGIVSLDDKKIFKAGWMQMPVGQHKIIVQVTKGPTGYFGPAPLLGTCYATFDTNFEPNTTYLIQFKRKNDKELVQLINKFTNAVITEELCITLPMNN